ncbi:MAG: hypothetical protein Q8L48_09305 [Archangium sp.]|nr:hypothetical protein [Archangium sp.]
MLLSLRAFAEALFSTEEGPPSVERMDWLMKEMDEYLLLAGPGARVIFGLALFVVVWLSPLFIGRLPTLRSLEVPERVEALTRMEESFASAPVLAVKAFLCVVYYEHPDVQREVGHVGPSTFPMRLGP